MNRIITKVITFISHERRLFEVLLINIDELFSRLEISACQLMKIWIQEAEQTGLLSKKSLMQLEWLV